MLHVSFCSWPTMFVEWGFLWCTGGGFVVPGDHREWEKEEWQVSLDRPRLNLLEGTGHSPPPHSWWSPGSLKSQPVHRKKPYSEACQWVSSPTWNCFKNKQNKKLCWILWVSMIHWEIDVYHILIHFRSLGLRTLLQGNGCVCVTLTGQGVARYITTLRVTGWPSTLPMMCEESAHLRKK